MHCPQCGKSYTAVQSVCPACYVELVKDPPRPAHPLGSRVDFSKMGTAQQARAAVEPARDPLPPTAPLQSPAAPSEDELPTGKLTPSEDELPTGKLVAPSEDELPTGELAEAPTASRSEAERVAALAAALMRRHEPEPEPVAEPARPAPAPVLVERWSTHDAVPASPQRRPGKAEWALALLLFPILLAMWFWVVRPLMLSANAAPPPVKPAEPIDLPAGLSPEDTLANARSLLAAKKYRQAASEAQLALTVWERQPADPKKIREARALIADANARAGDDQQALAVYDRMVRDNPADGQARSEAARIRAKLQKAGRLKARATFEQARTQFVAGDYSRAVATARTALQLAQQFGADQKLQARCSSLVGRGYLKLGRLSEAIAALGQAVALDPSDRDARQSLAAARGQLAREQEALRSRYSGPEPAPPPQARREEPVSYPQANSRPDERERPRRLPPPRRPRSNYNPEYSVPGTRYTPREPEMPDVATGRSDSGGLPTYEGNRQSNLPSYSSGSGENKTLPTYSDPRGGVYPGYQSSGPRSTSPPGY